MTAATTTSIAPAAGRIKLSSIVIAGLGGGLVDITYACIVGATRGRSPEKVLQSVASGWLDKASYQGGWATAALGLVTHFGIVIVMAAVYALASLRLPILRQRPLIMGALYGVALYGVMYGIVLPLRWPAIFPKFDGVISVTDVMSHIGVGLVIALVLARSRRADHA
jgi:uncharacterized membrane protein YagU involved in acid resistance